MRTASLRLSMLKSNSYLLIIPKQTINNLHGNHVRYVVYNHAYPSLVELPFQLLQITPSEEIVIIKLTVNLIYCYHCNICLFVILYVRIHAIKQGWKRWVLTLKFFVFSKKISKGRTFVFFNAFWILIFRINFVLKASNQTIISLLFIILLQ